MEDNDNSNILFKYKDTYVESFIFFDDGDFLIFFKYNAKLYDGKTLQQKQDIDGYSSCFYLLSQEEYAQYNDHKYDLLHFSKDRTSSKFIQTIHIKGQGMKITKMSNGELLVYSYYLFNKEISVFRKNNLIYERQNQFVIEDLNEIIELNDNEFLGHKYSLSPEVIKFKVLNKDNYEVKRKNEIKCICNNYKKRIYLTQPIFKVSNNKLLSLGINNIYIFDIKTLDLETTIKISLNKEIIKMLIRPKGNILLICKETIPEVMNPKERDKFYIKNIRINYLINEFENKGEKDITDKIGDTKNIFEFYNYLNDGLAIIIDKKEIIIFKNYND